MEADALTKEMSQEGSHVKLRKCNKASAMALCWVRSGHSPLSDSGVNELRAVLQSWAGEWNTGYEPRKQIISWDAGKQVWPEGWGREVVLPLSSALMTPHLQCCLSSGISNMGRTWTCWSRSRGGHKNAQRAGAALLWGQAERAGITLPRNILYACDSTALGSLSAIRKCCSACRSVSNAVNLGKAVCSSFVEKFTPPFSQCTKVL